MRFLVPVWVAIALAMPPLPLSDGASAPASQSAPAAPIRITNYKAGETLRFPVPLIQGELADPALKAVTVVNTSSKRDTREMTGQALKGRFKALTELVPGENKLLIRAGKDELPLTLVFKPQTNTYIARVVYITDSSGKTEFQTPLPNDPQDFRGKLDTAMKIMQTFTAERMNDAGFGRRTFNLELGEDGRVLVHLLKGRGTIEHYRTLDGGQLYGEVAGELARKLPAPKATNLVIPAFTWFDANTKKALAHTALGGGNLALFGGGDLFCWPDRLADVQKAFMDETRVDPDRYFSDSVGRHTFWGTASTTIGAALHELGHTFDLPHSREVHDIMTRGHDRLNRFFTLIEPPHAGRKTPYAFKDAEIACWAPVSAGALAPCRFFAMDQRTWSDQNKTGASLDSSGGVVIESDYVLRYVGVYDHSPKYVEAVYAVPVERDARQMKLSVADLSKRLDPNRIELKIMDDQGLSTRVRLPDLMKGPYVQSWQFASITMPWTNGAAFVSLDAGKLAEIEASAGKAKPVRSRAAFVDFLSLCPGSRKESVAGYALRTIRCDAARKIKLHTGSDDALRVWLNGKVVVEVLQFRGAVADSESTAVELQKGQNKLLVEVSQGSGGWGLYLRLEDADGKRLELKDDGTLAEK
jgi:hypothetical protein